MDSSTELEAVSMANNSPAAQDLEMIFYVSSIFVYYILLVFPAALPHFALVRLPRKIGVSDLARDPDRSFRLE